MLRRRLVACGYCRVSTAKQVEQGLSLAAQEERIRRYARESGIVLRDIIVDAGQSGGSLDRDGARRLLAGLGCGSYDTVIVCKLDRLTRSVKDLCTLLDRHFSREGLNLISINESFDTRTPSGRLVLSILASLSQWERETIAERTREAIGHVIEQGGHFGAVPFGHQARRDRRTGLRKLVPVAAEQAVLRRIEKMHDEGHTFAAIADRLNEQGVKPRRGTRWNRNIVYNLLARRGKLPQRSAHNARRADPARSHRAAEQRVYELRTDGGARRSCRAIARTLNAEGFRPARADRYSADIVYDMLQNLQPHDLTTPFGIASALQRQGRSLRDIARELHAAGFLPPRGGRWYAASVSNLLLRGDRRTP